MLLLAQATIVERSLFLARAFVWVLAGAGALIGLFFVLFAIGTPVLTAMGTPGALRVRRILTSYLVAGPLVLFNLLVVFALFVAQFIAIQWLYGTVASPHHVFESAFDSATGGLGGRTPELVVLDRLKGAAGVHSGGYYGPMAAMTKFVLFCYSLFNWGVLLFLLFAMLRDLAVTSWGVVAAPIQREVHGRPWWDLAKAAIARLAHVVLYTFAAGFFFGTSALAILAVSWVILRMVAGLLVNYLIAIGGSGFMPFLLLGSFYVFMLEVLGALFYVTGLLSFVASRSISLRIERGVAKALRLPQPAAPPPKIWPALKASAKLLFKVFVAVVPVWLVMGFLAGHGFPLFLLGPMGLFFHILGFNVVLALLRAHRDLKPLAVEGWVGRPWNVEGGGKKEEERGAKSEERAKSEEPKAPDAPEEKGAPR